MNKVRIDDEQVDQVVYIRSVDTDISSEEYYNYTRPIYSFAEFLQDVSGTESDSILDLNNVEGVPIGAGGIAFNRDVGTITFVRQEESSELIGLSRFSVSAWVNLTNVAEISSLNMGTHTYNRGTDDLTTVKTAPFECTIIDCAAFKLSYYVVDATEGQLKFTIHGTSVTPVYTYTLSGTSRLHNLDGSSIVTLGSPDVCWVRVGVSCNIPDDEIIFNSSHAVFAGETTGTPILTSGSSAQNYGITTTTHTDIYIACTRDKENPFHGILNDVVVFKEVWDHIPQAIRDVLNEGEGGEYVNFRDDTTLSDVTFLHFNFAEEQESDTVQNSGLSDSGLLYGRMVEFGQVSPTTTDLLYSGGGLQSPTAIATNWFYFVQHSAHHTILRVNEFPQLKQGEETSFSISFWISPEKPNTSLNYTWDDRDGDPVTYNPKTVASFYRTPHMLVSLGTPQRFPDFDFGMIRPSYNASTVSGTFSLRFRVFDRRIRMYVTYVSPPVIFHVGGSEYPHHISLSFHEPGYGANPAQSLTLYVDGEVVECVSRVSGGYRQFNQKSDILWIGSNHNQRYLFSGFMSDFRFTSRAITSQEVASVYNEGSGTDQVEDFGDVSRLMHFRLDDRGVWVNEVFDWALNR